jgi:hypothetical protein
MRMELINRMSKELLRRKKLAFKIVEMLEIRWKGLENRFFDQGEYTDDWDTDEAIKVVASVIPQSMADLDAELEAMIPKEGVPAKPSPIKSEFTKLREVLGIDDKHIGIMQTLKAAREEIIKVRASRDEWKRNYNKWITSLGVKPE